MRLSHIIVRASGLVVRSGITCMTVCVVIGIFLISRMGWLCPDKKALREALRSGQWGAIVNSVHKTGKDEWMGHYSFLYWDEGLKAANLYSNEAITDIDHVELKDMMTYQVFDFDGGYYQVSFGVDG